MRTPLLGMVRAMNRTWNAIDWIAVAVVIVGGVNWGLVGFFDFNLVEALFGNNLSAIIYSLVGLAALYMIYSSIKVGQVTPRYI